VLKEASPEQLAGVLAGAASHTAGSDRVGPFLADVVNRVRSEGWLEPLAREWVGKFRDWARSDTSREVIHRHLARAKEDYGQRSLWKNLTMRVAEATGGVDLAQATEVLQTQMATFAEEQLAEEGQIRQLLEEGLGKLEGRLRDDPTFIPTVRGYLLNGGESKTLTTFLTPLLVALKDEANRELDREDSRVLGWVMDHLQEWVDRLAQDAEARERLNAWCRRTAAALIEKHHALIGAMVEDRLNRFDDAALVTMIENKVGEDLNWIRINGSLVGGMVGVLLFLSAQLVELVVRGQ